jgi:ParB family transcriptional regulator, chromosome partitioning protein
MSKGKRDAKIKMVAIEQINILNPRVRNQKIFFDIATNITKVGLKRPITVTTSKAGIAGKEYDLVCGQGRIEAFMACGQKEIPAIVIDASEEQALIMSLVENLARRQHRAPELLQGIEILRKQGYDGRTIAEKTGLSVEYVNGVMNLMEKGEERLVAAVEAGYMPMALAIRIATSPEDEQHALQEAYESKELRGNRLLMAKRLLDSRRRRGKTYLEQSSGRRTSGGERKVSVQAVLKAYKREADRKKMMARKANKTAQHLLFSKRALRDLMQDQDFKNLLQAEKLLTLPKPLADYIAAKGEKHG